MNQLSTWMSQNYVFVIIGGTLLLGVVLIVIVQHDINIDREQLLFSIHSDRSCEKLFKILEFENRKIMKDHTELSVLKHYIMVKNC